jgi:hypothetical protein
VAQNLRTTASIEPVKKLNRFSGKAHRKYQTRKEKMRMEGCHTKLHSLTKISCFKRLRTAVEREFVSLQ